jgi:hypothetical protein
MLPEYNFTDETYFPEVDPRILSILYFRHIYRRVHDYKFNFLGFLTGKHRVGKSLNAVNFGTVLDSTFLDNLEDRVAYYASDFTRALKQIRDKHIIGGVVIWDEAGVGVPAREWYNTSNKAIGMTLQVFGRYRPIVFFVTQDMSYIDSQARKLFHGFYEVSRVKNDYSLVKPFNVSYDKKSNKIFFQYSRLFMPNGDAQGSKLVLKKIKIKRPMKEVEDAYEYHSAEFKDIIMNQMQERTEQYEKGRISKKKLTVEEIVQDLQGHKEDPVYLAKRSHEDNIIFDRDAVRIKYNIPDAQARFIKKQAELIANEEERDEGDI